MFGPFASTNNLSVFVNESRISEKVKYKISLDALNPFKENYACYTKNQKFEKTDIWNDASGQKKKINLEEFKWKIIST